MCTRVFSNSSFPCLQVKSESWRNLSGIVVIGRDAVHQVINSNAHQHDYHGFAGV